MSQDPKADVDKTDAALFAGITNQIEEQRSRLSGGHDFDFTWVSIATWMLRDTPGATLRNVSLDTRDALYRWLKSVADNLQGLGDQQRRTGPTLARILERAPSAIGPLLAEVLAAHLSSDHLTAVRTAQEEAVTALKQEREAIEALLKKVGSLTSGATISAQSARFDDEASRHQDSAKKWAWIAGFAASLVVLFCAAVVLGKIAPVEAGSATIVYVQSGAAKSMAFLTLSGFLVVALRNFAGHKHNAIIGRHRRNSLDTFQTLSKTDEKVRDAFLPLAAQSIFAFQPTGFSKDGEDAKAPTINVGLPPS